MAAGPPWTGLILLVALPARVSADVFEVFDRLRASKTAFDMKCDPNNARYANLVKRLPPISLEELLPPRDSRLLFYGTSYMNQITSNIFVTPA